MIKWFREKARAWCPDVSVLNGISFRGGAQALREEGFSMDELGILGRWLTVRAAARYVNLTDAMVDRFAGAFDEAAKNWQIYETVGVGRTELLSIRTRIMFLAFK